MLFKQLIEAFDIIDSKNVNGNSVASYLKSIKQDADIQVYPLVGPKGSTDMLKIRIPGLHGKTSGGDAPTIGLLGRLGGLGARPERIGYVSDGDGALVAIALAAKLLDMQNKGDFLEGDVFISTHICPDAPTAPHVPVPFMGSPVEMAQVNAEELTPELDAVLSVFPLTQQDITPYGNDLHHLNSILQPATATNAPVVGIAITTETTVPGCATGASHMTDLDEAARFMLEVAKSFGRRSLKLYDEEEFEKLQSLYGSMKHFQKLNPFS